MCRGPAMLIGMFMGATLYWIAALIQGLAYINRSSLQNEDRGKFRRSDGKVNRSEAFFRALNALAVVFYIIHVVYYTPVTGTQEHRGIMSFSLYNNWQLLKQSPSYLPVNQRLWTNFLLFFLLTDAYYSLVVGVIHAFAYFFGKSP